MINILRPFWLPAGSDGLRISLYKETNYKALLPVLGMCSGVLSLMT